MSLLATKLDGFRRSTIGMPRRFFSVGLPAAALPLSSLPKKVQDFVNRGVALCKPDNVHVCDGSEAEYKAFMEGLIKQGTVQKLSETKRPGSYIAYTDPKDVARAEKDTFICSEREHDSGPTNNWRHPSEKRKKLEGLFDGCMRGRTMYVVPFSMGPLSSPFSKSGVQLTDSSYVAASMRIMTRMGEQAVKKMTDDFVPCMHSVGRPIIENDPDKVNEKSARSFWPCNIAKRHVVHYPETSEIWSFGSGYGGNSLLGKKCFALRIASVLARKEGWLAEHMLILGITNPEGKKKYFAAAFPSACGKTNLAMMDPLLPGWKIETVGDDIAWIRVGKDGKFRAINPEYGFFGVAPGTSSKTNPRAMQTCAKNSVFTNVGLTEDGDVYWEGMDSLPSASITDWERRKHWKPTLVPDFQGGYKQAKTGLCAQANSRFTTPITQCPVLDPKWDDPEGVPIEGIIFGGRRDDTLPLVFETFSWEHGTFVGSVMRSEATSAADQSGLTNDPMAMKAFCGYNIKDYFAHWLKVGASAKAPPKIFHVNWFRKNNKGDFVWPGFGDNIRVLKWMFDRCENPTNTANIVKTPIGYTPTTSALDISNLNVSQEDMKTLLHVDKNQWLAEAAEMTHYYNHTLSPQKAVLGEPDVPLELRRQLKELKERLSA